MTQLKNKKLRNHEDVLEAVAAAIDIPEHLHEKARDRYQSIGKWLDRDGSSIKQYNPVISPQGSFLLGTVIRPIGDTDDYDIDAVCTLNGSKTEFTMSSLKTAVGNELREYTDAHGMRTDPKDKRRCWTLEYADEASFHMDILPSLPDESGYVKQLTDAGHVQLAANKEISSQGIAITDKKHRDYSRHCEDWPVSNPRGYAIWFRSRQSEALAAKKKGVFERDGTYENVDDVPDYKVKTPLQRAIQLLKRHRDSMFQSDDEKPISIIITTLAAHAYNGESTIVDALRSILKNMDKNIILKNGIRCVLNPVYPKENFADKWAENPSKGEKFDQWLRKARLDFGLYLRAASYQNVPNELQQTLSQTTMDKILPLIAVAAPAIISSADAGAAEVERVLSEGRATKPWAR